MPKSLEDMLPGELLEHTRKLEESNRLFTTLVSDPETRAETLALVKRKNPTMAIPELDEKAARDAALAAERAEREKLEARVRDQEIRERLRNERERVKKDHGLTDEDLTAVEALMVDEKAPIPHYDAAAKVYKASRVEAKPSSSQLTANTFDMPDKNVWAKGVGNPMSLNKVFQEEAARAINEMRGNKAA